MKIKIDWKKFKEALKKYWWILLIALIVFGLFYWYQIRPSYISSVCYRMAVEKAIEKAKEETGIETGKFRSSDYDFYYKLCLMKKGIRITK